MMDWPELDALLEELRGGNEERWQEAQELRQQFGQLQAQLGVLAQQYEALQVHDALQALNDRLLSGMGTLELVHSGIGIEYIVALVWPAYVDARVAAADAAASGLYRIEVWLGPGMQDGQPRIRIAGEKRLEAKLPTSTERFRAALLSVFRNPRFVAHEAPVEEPEEEVGPEGSAASEEQPQDQSSQAEPAAQTEPSGDATAQPPEQPDAPETEGAIPMGPPAEPPSPT